MLFSFFYIFFLVFYTISPFSFYLFSSANLALSFRFQYFSICVLTTGIFFIRQYRSNIFTPFLLCNNFLIQWQTCLHWFWVDTCPFLFLRLYISRLFCNLDPSQLFQILKQIFDLRFFWKRNFLRNFTSEPEDKKDHAWNLPVKI